MNYLFGPNRTVFKKSNMALSVVLTTTASINIATAQTAEEQPTAQLEEVVVTGTLIRGIKPTGSQVLGISSDDIKATGAVSSAELLGSLPQANNLFNASTTVQPGAAAQLQVVRPNLRNLPGGNLATGAATLILMDGHRVPSVGVRQYATDPDMIPPSIVQRVEVITDGGSSTYGADAVGGVINFITRKDFEGVQIDGSYGRADDYNAWDASVTAGTTWKNGSGYVSFGSAEQDSLKGKDRDWSQRLDWNTGTAYDEACASSNVRIGAANYAAPSFTQGTTNYCDNSQGQALSPKINRKNFFIGLNQDLTDSIELDVKGFYSERVILHRAL